MKNTGIIRRIDDLGRVVVPKEIRRTLGLREGDPLELYVHEDMVCFKRYKESENLVDDLRRIRSKIDDGIKIDARGTEQSETVKTAMLYINEAITSLQAYDKARDAE